MQQRQSKKPNSSNRRGNTTASHIILAVLVLILAGVVVFQYVIANSSPGEEIGERTVTPRGDLADFEKTQIQIYESAVPSVVHVDTLDEPGHRDGRLEGRKRGSGSGFIWDKHGHIITNYHVVHQGKRWSVTLHDRTTWEAELKGVAPHKDIAVLKIKAPKSRLKPIDVGTSADLKVGQSTYAIGFPFGLEETYSTGVISGLQRTIKSITERQIRDVIQTDAAINPGNSGGPLLDSAARLIGMNTAIVSKTGVYSGIGFAVPVDEIRQFVPQLIKFGKVIRPGLGITYFSDAHVARLRLANRLSSEGVLVRDVMPDSAASKAGIQPTRYRAGRYSWGDLIVAVDGKKIRRTQDLFDILESLTIGKTVTISIIRNGQPMKTEATLQEL